METCANSTPLTRTLPLTSSWSGVQLPAGWEMDASCGLSLDGGMAVSLPDGWARPKASRCGSLYICNRSAAVGSFRPSRRAAWGGEEKRPPLIRTDTTWTDVNREERIFINGQTLQHPSLRMNMVQVRLDSDKLTVMDTVCLGKVFTTISYYISSPFLFVSWSFLFFLPGAKMCIWDYKYKQSWKVTDHVYCNWNIFFVYFYCLL